MTHPAELVEAVARAIIDSMESPTQAGAKRVATAVLDLLASRNALVGDGMVAVPRVPTEAMLRASWANTVRATTAERIACELGSTRQVHMLKMERRYGAMIEAARAASTTTEGET